MTEQKRDLAADLRLCEETTWPEADEATDVLQTTITRGVDDRCPAYFATGPMRMALAGKSVRARESQREAREQAERDAQWIVAARDGWPEAIRRAMEAEAEVERQDRLIGCLEAALDAIRGLTQEPCPLAQKAQMALDRIYDAWHEDDLRVQEAEQHGTD